MTTATGDDANNTLTGTDGADELHGQGGIDTLLGLGGADVIEGGSGNDLLQGDYTSTSMFPAGGDDWLYGGADNDLAVGGVGSDHLYGEAGNDILVGGTSAYSAVTDAGALVYNTPQEDGGNDYYDGGAGDDLAVIVYNRAAGVTLDLHDPNTVTSIQSAGSEIGTIAGIERLFFYGLGTGSYFVTGGAGWDLIWGGSGNDIFHGGGGLDTLIGNGGDNQLYGEEGEDSLVAGAGNDYLDGGDGSDLVQYDGTTAGVTVDLRISGPQNTGGGGTDTIVNVENLAGTAFTDVLRGNDLRNVLSESQGGDDQLFGYGGNDELHVSRYTGAASTILLDGAAGYDDLSFISTRPSNYVDTVVMNGGDSGDTLGVYGAGTATLSGGGGDDIVHVDVTGGAVQVSLGTGDDRLILRTYLGTQAYAAITVTDFDPAHDTVDLSELIANTLYDVPAFEGGYLRLVQDGANTLLQIDTSGGADDYYTLVTFQGLIAANLTPANFLGLPLNAYVTGTDFADTLLGGAFTDQFVGGADFDTLYGEQGNDMLYGDSPWEDENLLFSGNDWLHGGEGKDLLIGGGGDDQLYGDAGEDVLRGGGGNDYLDGGEGFDIASFETANQSVTVSLQQSGQDTSSGWDTLTSIEGLIGSGYEDALTGDDQANSFSGGYGDDLINALGGDDTIYWSTGEGSDRIFGGDGSDTLFLRNSSGGVTINLVTGQMTGGAATVQAYGIERLIATDHADTITANGGEVQAAGGDDTVRLGSAAGYFDGGEGTDTVVFTSNAGTRFSVDLATGRSGYAGQQLAGFENVTTGAGDDSVNGDAHANVIVTGDGTDRLNGGAGADRLEGGLGNDTYVVDDAGDLVIEAVNAGIDTVEAAIDFVLAANVENLKLSGAAIHGTGNALANLVKGNSQNNILDGGAGADDMRGGKGEDVYFVDNVGDKVVELDGEGNDTVDSSVTFSLANQYIEVLNLTGSAAINGTGNGLNNRIVGNGAANTLIGGDGNDRLDGGAGADTLKGGLGNDTYVVENAGDKITENNGDGTDTVEAWISYSLVGQYIETLKLMGSDNLGATGNGQVNALYGNAGNNMLNGMAGADTMAGGAGDDTYVVDDAGDKVIENANEGTDLVQSSVTFSLANQYIEALTLTGSAAVNGTGNNQANTLTGNTAANTLNGSGGDDQLHGGLGSDTLTGGAGLDTFWFETALGASNVDTITDFKAADDTINLDRTIFSGITANGALAGTAFYQGAAAHDADDRIVYDKASGNIYYDADGTGAGAAVLFAHVAANTALTAADFFAVA